MPLRDRKGDYWIMKCGYKDCDRIFITVDSRTAHLKTHDPSKDVWLHRCGFKNCGAAYTRRADYREHLLKEHNIKVKVKSAVLIRN
jgi:uncharacterized C2H2 Zn-finger protein